MVIEKRYNSTKTNLLVASGSEPASSSAAELHAALKNDTFKWRRLINKKVKSD